MRNHAGRDWFATFVVVAAFGSAAAGCGEQLETEEAITTEQRPIIGGATTLARPEVAFFATTSEACSAVLISKRVFLTAAHCVDYAAARPGGVLQIERATTGGGKTRFLSEISTVHSLHNVVGGMDLAIGVLTTDVPADFTQGVMMTNAPTTRGSNELFTMLGYGCTGSPGVGTGVKRFREFVGRPPLIGCKGDSGGGTFRGALNAGGELVGITSAVGNDTVVSASIYKLWAEGMTRRLIGAEVGFDRFGFDVASTTTDSANACAVACRQDIRCKAYTFVNSTKGCHFKDVAAPTSPNADATSGLGDGQNRQDMPGGDLQSFAADSAEFCEAECGRNSACKGYVFKNATCTLKSLVSAGVACPACRSGLKKGFEVGIDRPGNDLRDLVTSTVQACATECQSDAFCDSFSYVTATRRCFLKVHAATPVRNAGVISGVRGGIEYATDRVGADLRNFPVSAGNIHECQAACNKDAACRAWSLTTGPSGFGDRCYLKNGIPASSFAPGIWSGRKGMDFF